MRLRIFLILFVSTKHCFLLESTKQASFTAESRRLTSYTTWFLFDKGVETLFEDFLLIVHKQIKTLQGSYLFLNLDLNVKLR
jgi:hypothetical protein